MRKGGLICRRIVKAATASGGATSAPSAIAAPHGTSGISQIDSERNVLTYRGYNIQDLCDHAGFEEVAYLILHGELPDRDALARFEQSLAAERAVPDYVYQTIRLLPPNSDPMDWLKVAVAALAVSDPHAAENGHDANLAKAIRLTAKLPAIIANGWRLLHGQQPSPPAQVFSFLSSKPARRQASKTSSGFDTSKGQPPTPSRSRRFAASNALPTSSSRSEVADSSGIAGSL